MTVVQFLTLAFVRQSPCQYPSLLGKVVHPPIPEPLGTLLAHEEEIICVPTVPYNASFKLWSQYFVFICLLVFFDGLGSLSAYSLWRSLRPARKRVYISVEQNVFPGTLS